MAFQATKSVGGQELIRVDYEKYLFGEEDTLPEHVSSKKWV